MTIADWLHESSQRIPYSDAELLLLHFAFPDKDRSYLIAHDDETLAPNLQLEASVQRRAEGCPIAYLLGYRDFYGRNFTVEEGKTLIPRPETEDIIEFCLDIAEASEKPLHILDVGTGSGCIATTLALEIPDATIDAVDISPDALIIAKNNAKKFDAKVNFAESNLLENYDQRPDVVVANLPYVDKKWDWLDQHALSYEPDLALYANDAGLELIFELIAQFCEKIHQGYLILEADPSQHKRIISVATARGLELTRWRNFILQFQVKS